MKAVAQAQPNIALIKYWGKRDRVRNLPAVSSLSVTLDSLWTRTTVDLLGQPGPDRLRINGKDAPDMLKRVSRCIDNVVGLKRFAADVSSEGNFPIGAGLASSASAFAALVVASNKAAGESRDTQTLARLAGASSGSAARSLYGGFVELTAGEEQVTVKQLLDGPNWPLEVIVAVTEKGPKAIGSGEAMLRGQNTSPFYSSWIERQDDDLAIAREAVLAKDFAKLATVAEHNCLKMHSVMWTSRPSIVYWNEATIACLEVIRALQSEGHAVFFTIDAGPQVKAICSVESAETVLAALQQTSGVIDTMRSSLGVGAALLEPGLEPE